MRRTILSFAGLALLALSATIAEAQQRRVAGIVTATAGEPLPAASVQVVGTTTGTYTDDQGRFALTVPDGAQSLRVRRIGYKQRVVAVTAAQTDLNVTLDRDVLQLEKQIVTGTNTSQSSANAANAVT